MICLTLALGSPNQEPNVLSLNSCSLHHSSPILELSVSTYGENLPGVISKVLSRLWALGYLSPNPSIRNPFLWIHKFLFGDVKCPQEGEHVKSGYKSLAFSGKVLSECSSPNKEIWCPVEKGTAGVERNISVCGQECRGADLGRASGTQEKWKGQVSRKYEIYFFPYSQFLFSLVPQGEWCTGKWIVGLIYFSDSYILIIFFWLPYDQSCVSSHSCLDTPSLNADKLPKDEFNFVRILELYLQGGFLPPDCLWSKFVDSKYFPADCKFWIWC